MSQIKIREKFPRFVRWCHWVNFPLLTLMTWSGILIYWANQAYISIPESVAHFFHLDHHLALAMGWHFYLMWPFALNGILYTLFLIFTGEWRELLPDRAAFPEALAVIKHDMLLSKESPVIRKKLNGAQRIIYSLILVIGTGAILSGLAIYKPVQLSWITTILGGYEAARFEHFLFMSIFIGFFFLHIMQVIRAGWNNFQSMVAGYEVIHEQDKANQQE